MPSDWPQEAHPRTAVVGDEGTASLTYTVPGGVIVKVESVVAAISAAAGADTPVLTITDDAGEVVYAKGQGSAIPLAGTGTATWALR